MGLEGFDTLRYDVAESGVATITLDQPDTRNALSTELLDDLLAAFTLAREDADAYSLRSHQRATQAMQSGSLASSSTRSSPLATTPPSAAWS